MVAPGRRRPGAADRARRCRPAGWASRTPASSWPTPPARRGRAGLRRRRRRAARRTRSPPPSRCCAAGATWSARTRGRSPGVGRAAGAAAAAVVLADVPAAAGWRSARRGRRWRPRTGSCSLVRRAALRAGRRARRGPRPRCSRTSRWLRAVKRAGGAARSRTAPRWPTCRMYARGAELRDGYTQVAVGGVRLAGRRRGRRRRCCSLLGYVVPPLARAARLPGGSGRLRCRACAGGSLTARGAPAAGPGRTRWPTRCRWLLFGWLVARSLRAHRRRHADLEGTAAAVSRVVVVGAGVGGLAAAARLAAAGHEVTVCEQADVVGGKLGRLRAAHRRRHVPLRHRPVPADPAAGLRRPVRGDRRPLAAGLDLVSRSTRWSGTASPTAPGWTLRRDPACPPPGSDAAFGAGAAADWRRLWRARRADLGGGRGAVPGVAGRRRPRRWPRLAWRLGDLAHDRARPHAARAGCAATCATRGCGCCWTGTPPTPARTRAGRRPRSAAMPYVEQRSAAGTCAAGSARSPTSCSPGRRAGRRRSAPAPR